MPEGRELVLGTAGHIDHGKTALVEALTGRNTDRLAEERRRGISIELGFARLDLPGRTVGVVDVPGHRRLVRAMVAGASGIDMFLLVVAADDGVMPQTREHWTALRALGIERGVVALTKIDVAPDEARALALDEVAELAPGVPAVAVSSRTGAGLDELRDALAAVAADVGAEADRTKDGPAVMHLDRAFSLRGIGTVVTGTLRSGDVAPDDALLLLPSERRARIRGIHVHDEPVERATAGQRVALNLGGVDRNEVDRGDVIADPDAGVRLSYRLDVLLDFAVQRDNERVQVHHGTRQAPGRIVPLDSAGLAQLRLESPLIAQAGDRLVVRRIAPPDTLGGGTVVDPAPARHGPGQAAARLRAAVEAEPEELTRAEAGAEGRIPADPGRWRGRPRLGYALHRFGPGRLREAVNSLVDAGELTRTGDALVPRDRAQTVQPEPPAAPALGPDAVRVLRALDADGLQPRGAAALADALSIERPEVERALAALVASGHLAALGGGVFYPRERLERIDGLVSGIAAERGSIGLAELRDALRISRKYSQAILEHLDAEGVTIRHGDRHVLRRPLEARRPSG